MLLSALVQLYCSSLWFRYAAQLVGSVMILSTLVQLYCSIILFSYTAEYVGSVIVLNNLVQLYRSILQFTQWIKSFFRLYCSILCFSCTAQYLFSVTLLNAFFSVILLNNSVYSYCSIIRFTFTVHQFSLVLSSFLLQFCGFWVLIKGPLSSYERCYRFSVSQTVSK
jgi:hypothetical protein